MGEIILGDAYELIKAVPDKSIDLIVTDPPYDLTDNGYGSVAEGKWYSRPYAREITQDNLKSGIDLRILDDFARVLKRVNIYLWCNKEQIYDYMTYFVQKLGCNFEILIWAKQNPPPFTNGHYLKDKEYCLFFWEKGVKVKPTVETGKTVYVGKTNIHDKSDYGHPTVKPIDIISNLIINSCPEGGMVLDPFAGSGTTLVAAKRLGRDYLGFEISPKYHKIASDRLDGWNQKGQMNLFDI